MKKNVIIIVLSILIIISILISAFFIFLNQKYVNFMYEKTFIGIDNALYRLATNLERELDISQESILSLIQNDIVYMQGTMYILNESNEIVYKNIDSELIQDLYYEYPNFPYDSLITDDNVLGNIKIQNILNEPTANFDDSYFDNFDFTSFSFKIDYNNRLYKAFILDTFQFDGFIHNIKIVFIYPMEGVTYSLVNYIFTRS
jgi:hypothetical protein